MPVGVDDNATVFEDSGVAATGNVLTNDSDPNIQALTVTAFERVALGA